MSTGGSIPVVDFFAGPGGLGEGFSALQVGAGERAFKLALSVEENEAARRTLRLRAFVRQFPRGQLPHSYYCYVRGVASEPFDVTNLERWTAAGREAVLGTLGDPACDANVDARLKELGLRDRPWVLIGGPPCQAYSLVGRSRNAGIADYRPEDDDRHFLYRNYLSVLRKHRPAVFVMENVKGILSSSVAGNRIFHRILADLADPARAIGLNSTGVRYRIRALTRCALLESGNDAADFDPRLFVANSEAHGVPQARQRVILIGVRSDVRPLQSHVLLSENERVTVGDAISDLPHLRSGLSEGEDDPDRWASCVKSAAERFALIARSHGLGAVADELKRVATLDAARFPRHRRSDRSSGRVGRVRGTAFHEWCRDPRLEATLNHEARSHMPSDLGRYVFCAAYARALGRSPVARDFPSELAPRHNNWQTGVFADRFRVQLKDAVATTITSHISKDGHYFIHPDPVQCRSLTVREAARLQTFPDNYFFSGNRTEQYVQVGNAVPPLLAMRLASVVFAILK